MKPATVPEGVTVNGNSMTVRKGSGITIPRNSGGPGTDDPGRVHFPLISLKALLQRAYASYFEIDGPDWLDSDIVQLDATMPPDTTKEQFQEMLRNLITERFQLKYHAQTKQVTGYALEVTKNGPKIKESVATAAPPAQDTDAPKPSLQPRQMGPDGFPILPQRVGPTSGFQAIEGDRARMIGQQQTIGDLARSLGLLLKSTVTDETGLKSKYDYTVTYGGGFGRDGPFVSPPSTTPDTDALPDIFSALQSQLGLKLEQKKVAVEIFVVDRMEKVPTRN